MVFKKYINRRKPPNKTKERRKNSKPNGNKFQYMQVPTPQAQQPHAQQPVQHAQQPVQHAQQPVQHVQQPMMQQQTATVIATGGSQPDTLVAYLLWFFLGIIGIHHLYIGRGVGIWLLSLITLQGFGIWWFIDLFLIPGSCSKPRGGGIVVVA